MLFADVEDAASDGDEDEDGNQEAEDFRVEVEVDNIEAPGLDVTTGSFRFIVVDGFVEVRGVSSDHGFAGAVAGVADSEVAVEEKDENDGLKGHCEKGKWD